MAALHSDPDLAQQLLAQLEWVELHLKNHANLVGGGETDPGTSDWWASATVRVLPDEDEADGINPWHEIEGTALSTKRLDEEALDVTIFEANGLTLDLQHVKTSTSHSMPVARTTQDSSPSSAAAINSVSSHSGMTSKMRSSRSAATSSSSIEYSSRRPGAASAESDGYSPPACSAGSAPTRASSLYCRSPSTSTAPCSKTTRPSNQHSKKYAAPGQHSDSNPPSNSCGSWIPPSEHITTPSPKSNSPSDSVTNWVKRRITRPGCSGLPRWLVNNEHLPVRSQANGALQEATAAMPHTSVAFIA